MRNKQAEDTLYSPSERRHPKPVSLIIKEFASHVSNALGLSDRDLPPSSQAENDANLMAAFDMLSLDSDRIQIPFHYDEGTPPCKPGPSGTTTKKISAQEPNVDTMRIPKFTRTDFWITKDRDYQRIYNDDEEWDYIPRDSPLKGKEKARRIERHFRLPPLPPPNQFQQYDIPPPDYCQLPSVREYVWGQSDLLGNQERRYRHPLDLTRYEDGWITAGRPLSKRYKSRAKSGDTEVRLHPKKNGGDNSQDVVFRIPSFTGLDHFQKY
jgi:hypothetical protein